MSLDPPGAASGPESADEPAEPNQVRSRSLTQAQFVAHQEAMARGEDGYIDPDSGLFVMTERYLSMRDCCGSKCRHCPYPD